MLSPLKNRAMSWSEDCHGSPLALITVLSHTFSILLLHKCTRKCTLKGGLLVSEAKKSIKLYLPSAGFKFLTDSLLVGKCVDWGRKKAGLN